MTALLTPTGRRPRQSSRRRETVRPRRVLALGLGTLAAVVLLAGLALRAPNGLPLVSYRTLYASVADPGNLQPHSDVRIAGVHVGQVIGIRAAGHRALIEMKLGSGTRSLPLDTQVMVRAQGLLGARYVELIPGHSATTLRDGATLRAGPGALTYGVPDALNTFDRQTRGALGASLNALGIGLLARGPDLNLALAIGPRTAANFRADTAAVLAVPGAARRLVPSLEQAASALDPARNDIVAGLQPIRQGLQPFVTQRDAFNRTLTQIPPTLSVARPALDEAQRLLSSARALALAANRTLPVAPAALAQTTTLLRGSHTPLARADVLLRQAVPTVPAVLRVTGALSPVLTPLRQTLGYLQPIVVNLGQHGCDVYNMTSNWRSALGYGVRGSQGAQLPSGNIGQLDYFRVSLIAGTTSVQGLAAPPGPLAVRDVYPGPCQYAPGPAYINPLPSLGGR